MDNDLKVITVAGLKGGVKKTTIAHNYSEWLVNNGKKALLIDADSSMNFTRRYIVNDITEANESIIGIYEGKNITELNPIKVKENISLLGSSSQINAKERELESKIQRETLLYRWIKKNIKSLSEQFDRIVIDTRNDWGVMTLNALVAADIIIGLSDTSTDGYDGLQELRDVERQLKEIYSLETKLVTILTGTVKSQKLTQNFVNKLRKEEYFMGSFEENVDAKLPISLIEQSKSKKMSIVQENRLQELNHLFNKIEEEIKK
jgi:chromosome partitioning protein